MVESIIQEMLARLDFFYRKENDLKKNMMKQSIELEQLWDDIKMLENMIIYVSDKESRKPEGMGMKTIINNIKTGDGG